MKASSITQEGCLSPPTVVWTVLLGEELATQIPWANFVINLGCAKSGDDDTDISEVHSDPSVMSFF